MLSCILKYQYSTFETDEYQEKGVVDKEKAVEEFQFFPWDKHIDNFRKEPGHYIVPNISFISDSGCMLNISCRSLKGFDFTYSNSKKEYAEFYISNDFEKNNWTAEDMICFFFDQEIEDKINLKAPITNRIENEFPISEKKQQKPQIIEFEFNPDFFSLANFLSLAWVCFCGFLCIIVSEKQSGAIPGFVLIGIVGSTPVFLSITYAIRNFGARVTIDVRNRSLTYSKGKRSIIFNRKDLFRCQYTYGKRSPFDSFSYAWFILEDGKYIVITHMITDPLAVIEALNCKYEAAERGTPFLPNFFY